MRMWYTSVSIGGTASTARMRLTQFDSCHSKKMKSRLYTFPYIPIVGVVWVCTWDSFLFNILYTETYFQHLRSQGLGLLHWPLGPVWLVLWSIRNRNTLPPSSTEINRGLARGQGSICCPALCGGELITEDLTVCITTSPGSPGGWSPYETLHYHSASLACLHLTPYSFIHFSQKQSYTQNLNIVIFVNLSPFSF